MHRWTLSPLDRARDRSRYLVRGEVNPQRENACLQGFRLDTNIDDSEIVLRKCQWKDPIIGYP
jgi:hypothetical protein